MTDDKAINHDEALELAFAKRDESNLARCYIELWTKASSAAISTQHQDATVLNAKRYEWLRNNAQFQQDVRSWRIHLHWVHSLAITKTGLDAAIDAAIAAQSGGRDAG